MISAKAFGNGVGDGIGKGKRRRCYQRRCRRYYILLHLLWCVLSIITIGANVGEGIGDDVGDGVGDDVGDGIGLRRIAPLGFRKLH